MKRALWCGWCAPALFFSFVVGCGPSVSEMRMVGVPPKPAGCPLEFLQLSMEQISPASPSYSYEVIGHVMVFESGVQDPFQEKYRALVRERACTMGGEAVAIVQQATNSTMMASGTGIDYAVVRRRVMGGAPPPPMKF
jgi:hypothetical protein